MTFEAGAGGSADADAVLLDSVGFRDVRVAARSSIPSAPDSGYQKLFSDAAGRIWSRNSSGRLLYLGAGAGARRSTTTASNSSSATIQVLAAGNPTSDGTAAGVAIASTNKFTRTVRVKNSSAASTGADAGHRMSDFRYLGDNCLVKIVFGWETFQADAAAFIGMKGSAAHGNADPSSFINCIGVGIDSGQTTWRVIHNDGSGAATTIDLGANFPANTSATDLYELMLWWNDSATAVNYQLTRLGTSYVAVGTISSELPAQTQTLNAHIIGNTRSGSSAVELSWSQVMTESQ